MPLYSSGTSANAQEGESDTGTEHQTVSERRILPSRSEKSWCYLFVHHKQMVIVRDELEKKYRTFVHKSVIYKRKKSHVRKEEQPTITGLLFVQGDGLKVQKFLSENFLGLYLVKDCSTKRIAVIPDGIMMSFMQLSEIDPTRIRFMPHSFGYYAAGNTMVRLTSGPLAGFEGYRIRIARDKCLVTTFGGMTLAIGGIHKENFENVDEYVRQRRQQMAVGQCYDGTLTPVQAEIDASFLIPQNQLDVLALQRNTDAWMAKAAAQARAKDFNGATEIVLFLLEELGALTQRAGEGKAWQPICRSAADLLHAVLASDDVPADLKELIEASMQSLEVRFPLLPVDL